MRPLYTVSGLQTYVVLLAQLLAEGSAHDDTALAGGSLEVGGAALAARSRDGCDSTSQSVCSVIFQKHGASRASGMYSLLLTLTIVTVGGGRLTTKKGVVGVSALGDEEKKVEIRHGGEGIWWCAWTLWAKFRRIGGVHVTSLPYLWFLPLQACLDLGGPQTSAEGMTKHPSGATDFLFRKRSN